MQIEEQDNIAICKWQEFETKEGHENQYSTSCHYLIKSSRVPFQMNYCCYCKKDIECYDLDKTKARKINND